MQLFFNGKYKTNVDMEQRPELVYAVDLTKDGEVFPRYLHKHPDILELVFVTEGKGSHLIGASRYKTLKGDIMVFNAGVSHDETRIKNEILKTYGVGIRNFKLSGIPENHLLKEQYKQVISTGKKELEIREIYQLILAQMKRQETNSVQICNALTESLMYSIFQLPQEKLQYEPDVYESTKKIKIYLDEHYAEDVSLDGVAEELRVSTYYLSHVFKEQTGFSPKQYVIRRRMGKAQTLLINTKSTATRIATMVGYDNTNYFNTLFSKMVGVSPQRYRKVWMESQKSEVF